MMKVSVLTSGSQGNSTYIETKKHKILIDLGITTNNISKRLNNIGVDIADIDTVIISHTHADHISGLDSFMKKYKAKIYLSEKMIKEIPSFIDNPKIILYEDDICLDDILISSFKSSHDSNDARNFIISSGQKQIGYITDTGYINKKHFKRLENLELYLFESNHDIEMLMNGPYPTWLKRRVLGSYGHLSNRDAAIYLAKLIGPKTKNIVLIHLSQKNNKPQIALATINEVFAEYGLVLPKIICAEQNCQTEVIKI